MNPQPILRVLSLQSPILQPGESAFVEQTFRTGGRLRLLVTPYEYAWAFSLAVLEISGRDLVQEASDRCKHQHGYGLGPMPAECFIPSTTDPRTYEVNVKAGDVFRVNVTNVHDTNRICIGMRIEPAPHSFCMTAVYEEEV
jgi:hypothetical protein